MPLPASGILPIALAQMQEQTPDMAVSVLEASEQVLATALKARRIDLYLARISRDSQDPAFTFEILYEDTLCVIASAKHRLASI